jgi:hypothetical protein
MTEKKPDKYKEFAGDFKNETAFEEELEEEDLEEGEVEKEHFEEDEI